MSYLLLGRPDCHLCETFEEALRAHLAASGMDAIGLEHACVDDRGEWRMRYSQRIPVLLDDDGKVLAEGIFDAPAFDRARTA